MDLTFRQATSSEVAEVADLELQAIAAQRPLQITADVSREAREAWNRLFSAGQHSVFVAELDRELVAEAAVTETREEGGSGPPVAGSAHLTSIAVVPSRWGQGVAGRLLDHVVDYLRRQGYEQVECWTESDNTGSVRLYESRGWERTERKRDETTGEQLDHFVFRIA